VERISVFRNNKYLRIL